MDLIEPLRPESNTERLPFVLLELPLQMISPVNKCGPSNRLHSEILQVPFTFFRVTFVDTGNRMLKTDFSFPTWTCPPFVRFLSEIAFLLFIH